MYRVPCIMYQRACFGCVCVPRTAYRALRSRLWGRKCIAYCALRICGACHGTVCALCTVYCAMRTHFGRGCVSCSVYCAVWVGLRGKLWVGSRIAYAYAYCVLRAAVRMGDRTVSAHQRDAYATYALYVHFIYAYTLHVHCKTNTGKLWVGLRIAYAYVCVCVCVLRAAMHTGDRARNIPASCAAWVCCLTVDPSPM